MSTVASVCPARRSTPFSCAYNGLICPGRPKAVSYTHLDVYKRQNLFSSLSWHKPWIHRSQSLHTLISESSGCLRLALPSYRLTAVSYTHLDVYKRQHGGDIFTLAGEISERDGFMAQARFIAGVYGGTMFI